MMDTRPPIPSSFGLASEEFDALSPHEQAEVERTTADLCLRYGEDLDPPLANLVERPVRTGQNVPVVVTSPPVPESPSRGQRVGQPCADEKTPSRPGGLLSVNGDS